MTMNEKALYILEFQKIREMLAEYAQTDGARELALQLTSTADIDKVRVRQQRTTDAKKLVGIKG